MNTENNNSSFDTILVPFHNTFLFTRTSLPLPFDTEVLSLLLNDVYSALFATEYPAYLSRFKKQIVHLFVTFGLEILQNIDK